MEIIYQGKDYWLLIKSNVNIQNSQPGINIAIVYSGGKAVGQSKFMMR